MLAVAGPCCEAAFPTSGMGLSLFSSKPIPVISSELWDPKFELESCAWSASWALWQVIFILVPVH